MVAGARERGPATPAASGDWSRRDAVVILTISALAAIVVVLSVILDLDLSARRDVGLDVVMRDDRSAAIPPPRFADPSPFAVWLSSDLFVHRSLRAGELPLWDRSQAGGYSPLAYFQGGVLHPLRWLTALLPEKHAATALIIFTMTAFMVGAYLVGRFVLGCGISPSVAGAILASFGSYFLSLIHYSGAAVSFAHLPWLILAVDQWLRLRSYLRWIAIVVVCSLLLMAGHPSFILATGITAALYAVAHLIGRRFREWLELAFAPLAACLLAAMALLPFLASFSHSWTYKLETIAYEPLEISEWLERLSWMFFDDPYSVRTIDYGAFYGHLSTPLFLLATAGVVSRIQRRQLRAALLLGLVVGFVIAIPGPWMHLVASLPPLRFAKDWYLFGVFYFFVLMAAVRGIETLCNAGYRISRHSALLVLAVVAVGTFPRVVAALQVSPADELGKESPALRFLAERGQDSLFRISGLGGQVLLPNAGMWSRTEDLRITAPMLSRRYLQWLEIADAEGMQFSDATLIQNRDPSSPMFGAFNVRYFLQGREPFRIADTWVSTPEVSPVLEAPPGASEIVPYIETEEIDDPLLPLVLQTDHVNIYRNDRAYRPRAWLSAGFTVAADRREAERLLRQRPALSAGAPVVESLSLHSRPSRPLRWVVELRTSQQSESEVAVESTAPALLVLNEAFAPGWTAEVDGRRSELLPVNLLARGVLVPAGRHDVRFEYSPPGFRTGLAISGLTALLLTLWALVPGRRNHALAI